MLYADFYLAFSRFSDIAVALPCLPLFHFLKLKVYFASLRKVGLSASDGGDEHSSGSDIPGTGCKRRRSRDRFHHILDYNGPRLIAIEGSTVHWKCGAKRVVQSMWSYLYMWSLHIDQWFSIVVDGCYMRCTKPCCVPCDVSTKRPCDLETDENSSFLDFFGWNWDIYRNRVTMNDAFKLVELTSEEINAFVNRSWEIFSSLNHNRFTVYYYRDYKVATYIRDYVIPRAFDIYRRGQRTVSESCANEPGRFTYHIRMTWL